MNIIVRKTKEAFVRHNFVFGAIRAADRNFGYINNVNLVMEKQKISMVAIV